jgi:heme-degrading monooxygenase HmoA
VTGAPKIAKFALIAKGGEIMYARAVTIQMQPGKLDEAVRVFQDSVVPAIKQQKGFKRISMLIDRNTCKTLTVSFWETEADRTASETSGHFAAQLAKFGSFFAAPPITERYEVSVEA